MKFLARWSATLGLAGSLLFGAAAVMALPQEEIVKKLQSVPVFAIADAQGAPLVATPAQGENARPVAGVFVSHQDAQAFLTRLQQSNPELARSVRVISVSLSEVYKLNQTARDNSESLDFTIVPMDQQVQNATQLLRQQGQPIEGEFNGVPLFIARGGVDKGYLTIQQGNVRVIPIFFKKDELEALLNRFKQQQPDLANTIEIQVVNLEGVLKTLQESNNPELNQLVFIPPRESLEYVRSLQPASGQGNNRPANRGGATR